MGTSSGEKMILMKKPYSFSHDHGSVGDTAIFDCTMNYGREGNRISKFVVPICSTYGILTYIYHPFKPNVYR